MSFKAAWLRAALTASLILLAGSAGVVQAFVQDHDSPIYEVQLKEFDFHNYKPPATTQASSAAALTIGQRYGGAWTVYSWNPQTNTPSRMVGTGAKVASAMSTAADAEAVARAVIGEIPDVLGADGGDLRFTGAPRGLGKQAAHFQQTYEGLDVWQGKVRMTFTEDGRLFSLGSSFYSNISLDPNPSIDVDRAIELAWGDLPFDPTTDSIEGDPVLLVLPVPVSVDQVEHHLVWRVRVRTQDPVGIWVTHVDAHDGEIVWRYNDVHYLDFSGDTQGHIEVHTYCNGYTTLPLQYQRLTVVGTGMTYTDENGDWTIAYEGEDPQTLNASLYGHYVSVINQGGDNAAFSETVTPGEPIMVQFDDRNSQPDERDCFDAVNRIHDFFDLFDPGFDYTNQRITCNVSVNNSCNAFWDGSINMFHEAGGCANTGQIQGVIEHEFGHGVQWSILGFQGSQGLGEGNGDILANLITQDSLLGRGWNLDQCNSGLRNSDNNLVYPDDVVGVEIHSAGRVIAGFHWDFMKLLQALYGDELGMILAAERWHFGRVLEHPTDQPAQVLATFIADDDDGDLGNGTPHYDMLCEAAQNHGFDCPEITTGVFFAHARVPNTTDEGDAEVVATVTSTEGTVDAGSSYVAYRTDGGAFQQVALTATANPDEYHALIPGLAQPCEVEYYLHAEDDQGYWKNDPKLAPAFCHAFDVAAIVDPVELPGGWVVDLEGSDDAATGAWECVDPNGTMAQPEDDWTPDPGICCWVTGNAAPGEVASTNDVDQGTTTLFSPVYNLAGATYAKAKYWRWYSNDQGANPNTDLWVVQARNNGGSWIDIENAQDNQNLWVSRSADLIGIFGVGALGNVQFKFIASDTGTASLVEAGIDDFAILTSISSASVEGGSGGAAQFALYGSRSNPIMGPSEISFEVPAAAQVRLALYDVTGRGVRTIADGMFSAGVHRVSWDGKDSSGQSVPAGVYFYNMQAPGFTATRRVIVSH
ncbi:FlgD immunoglobulin-like domain containing protein [Candidatus Eisenbacteria bacterium]|uniref:FlgD immunoglobulin-like domain containing protein n=1 Tax=Eiseniibacteriota bacterium TaxID=2212470 RepID=A0ABV6YID6_UNCEI